MTREEIVEFIKEVNIGYMATMDNNNRPRVRPMGIHTIYDNDIYFFTFRNTRKVAEIDDNPKVEVVWAKTKTLSQVRICGEATIVNDDNIQQRFKDDEPIVSKILPPGAEHLFCLYKITPEKVEVAEGLVPYKEVVW
jgi:uncharacterized pyridoxamine 5'-phosphate oxidase family protein